MAIFTDALSFIELRTAAAGMSASAITIA
jgi:hypothetical protein